jgi:glycosyltransferase involved in cell wall biosynthesis
VLPDFRDFWIATFYMLSRCAYNKSDVVTCLFERAKRTQIELGCPPEKCHVIGNGVDCSKYMFIPVKEPDMIVDIGAIVRIVPIKDIKTLIYSFSELKHEIPNARLHILGDTTDHEYYQECLSLIDQLKVNDILLVGSTNVIQYLKKLDFTVLSSISEGQPLAVIESLAAKRPCVVTDVGSCRELVEGRDGDDLGLAGICVPPMHRSSLTAAMARLCRNKELREAMGNAGQKRVLRYYAYDKMIQSYYSAYERAFVNGRDRI